MCIRDRENISDIDKETFECKKEMFYDLMGTGAAMTGHKDGEIIPVKDLIYSLLIASGADDANALAYNCLLYTSLPTGKTLVPISSTSSVTFFRPNSSLNVVI